MFIVLHCIMYWRHWTDDVFADVLKCSKRIDPLLRIESSRGDWWVVIYTACKSLAKWWGMFLGTSHFDLEGWQKNPPVGFLGRAFPPGITNNFKKSNLCKFLVDSKDIYICGSVKTYTILQK